MGVIVVRYAGTYFVKVPLLVVTCGPAQLKMLMAAEVSELNPLLPVVEHPSSHARAVDPCVMNP